MYHSGLRYLLVILTLLSAAGAQKTAFQPSVDKLAEQRLRMTGNRLLEVCKITLEPPQGLPPDEISSAMGSCYGYISGTEDSIFTQWLMAMRCGSACSSFVERGFFCSAPEDTTRDVEVVVKWLRAHPENMDLPAAIAVQYALREAYPCNSESANKASPPPVSPKNSEGSFVEKKDSIPASPSVVAILEHAKGEMLRRNYAEAYAWTSLAMTGELTPTEKANLQLTLDSIASQLSKSKLKEAQERAAQLKSQYPQPPPRK